MSFPLAFISIYHLYIYLGAAWSGGSAGREQGPGGAGPRGDGEGPEARGPGPLQDRDHSGRLQSQIILNIYIHTLYE